tara:strand:- start:2666 stop:2968 length:303 start_codon:yes stop_codon:yes gene_type:complete
MSAITNFSINLEAIPKDLIIKGKKGSYINLTLFQNDETKYGNNASISLSQTQEVRESGEAKVYLGNGKVAWVSDEGVTVAERENAPTAAVAADSGDDLPF